MTSQISQNAVTVTLVTIILLSKNTGDASATCAYKETFDKDRDVVMSPNYPSLYPPGYCQWYKFETREGNRIALRFDDLDIPIGDKGECTLGSLHIYTVPEKVLCGHDTQIYYSDGPRIWMQFKGAVETRGRGFKLHYFTGPENEISRMICGLSEFQCDNGECLRKSAACNGKRECSDGSDEHNCKAFTPTEAPTCDRNEFSCGDDESQVLCVLNQHVCDGILQCPNGNDEKNCTNHQCGGDFKEPSGIIELSYLQMDPRIAQAEVTCKWSIVVDPTATVQLHIHEFVLERDYAPIISVLDDDCTSTKVLQDFDYTSQVPSVPLESTGNRICIQSTYRKSRESIFSITGAEFFSATYIQKKKSFNKGYDILPAYIASPNFPYTYPSQVIYSWILMVPHGEQIALQFERLHLQKHIQARIFVSSGDGVSGSKVLAHFTSLDQSFWTGRTIFSDHNHLLLKFVIGAFDNNAPPELKAGFNISVWQKGTCHGELRSCGGWDRACFTHDQHCDGRWDCLHGTDEMGCDKCPGNKLKCKEMSRCYKLEEHCNGYAECQDKSDEHGCTPTQCGHHNGTFLCRNRNCILESWKCDGTDDCKDQSDEENCGTPSNRVILAAVVGSLVCGSLLVIALGCTRRLYSLRLQQFRADDPNYVSPMSRLEAQIFMQQSAPPAYNEAMMTSVPAEEVEQDYINQVQQAAERWATQRSQRNISVQANSADIQNEHRHAPVPRSLERSSRNRGMIPRISEVDENNGQTLQEGDQTVATNQSRATSNQRETAMNSESTDSDSESQDQSDVAVNVMAGIVACFRRQRSSRLRGRGRLQRSRSQIFPYTRLQCNLSDGTSVDSSNASTESFMLSLTEEDGTSQTMSTSSIDRPCQSDRLGAAGPDITEELGASGQSSSDNTKSCDAASSDVDLVSDVGAPCDQLRHATSDDSLLSLDGADSAPLINL